MKHALYNRIVYMCVYVCACVLASCKPDSQCKENMVTGLVCEFRRAYVDDYGHIQMATTWDSITVVGIGATDTLYNNTKNKNKLVLPLHFNQDSTLYTLRYHNLTDTICVYHTNQNKFVNIECGCCVEHDMKALTHTTHWMDSVEIVSDTIRRSAPTNINIYLNDLIQ